MIEFKIIFLLFFFIGARISLRRFIALIELMIIMAIIILFPFCPLRYSINTELLIIDMIRFCLIMLSLWIVLFMQITTPLSYKFAPLKLKFYSLIFFFFFFMLFLFRIKSLIFFLCGFWNFYYSYLFIDYWLGISSWTCSSLVLFFALYCFCFFATFSFIVEFDKWVYYFLQAKKFSSNVGWLKHN